MFQIQDMQKSDMRCTCLHACMLAQISAPISHTTKNALDTTQENREEFLGYRIWEISHKAVHDYTAWITGSVVGESDREMIRNIRGFPAMADCVYYTYVLQGLCCKTGQIK